MKTPSILSKLSHKLAASRFLSVSLAIHLVLIALLSTIVIIKAKQESAPFSGEIGVSVTPVDDNVCTGDPDPPLPEAKLTEFTPTHSASWIGAVGEGVALPFGGEQSFGDSFIGSSTGSFQGLDRLEGHGNPTGPGGPQRFRTLCSIPIEAKKLGVVLDISGSAHGHLHRPLREIEASFQDAVVILYAGCGMNSDAKKRDFDVKRGGAIKLGQFTDPKAKPKNVGEVLDQASLKNAELRNDLGQILAWPNLYGMEWGEDNQRAIFGVHFALQRLVREDVDAIYWFADFQDEVNPELLKDLTAEMKRRHIKVYCHNFAGKFPSPAREAAIRAFAEETGGQCIVKVPGK